MTLLEKTIKFVDKSYGRQKMHFERTLYWLFELNPDADEALQIAAYAHDIERAFGREDTMKRVQESDKGFQDESMLTKHQVGGAEIMKEYLLKQGASPELSDRVAHLISRHEVGGNNDQNLLKDADSISYFETNAAGFVEKFVPLVGKEKVKAKFDWMFERITSGKARKLAQPMYEKALKMLHNHH